MARAGALLALAAASLARPLASAAAAWNRPAFESTKVADALKSLGAANVSESRDIVINLPDISENGAVVPVSVTSRIPNTQSIAIIAEKNPFPLSATFDLANGAEPYVSTRIKLAETTAVRAVVKANNRFYMAAREIRVTVGGCG